MGYVKFEPQLDREFKGFVANKILAQLSCSVMGVMPAAPESWLPVPA
jgi:hypothetical protein